MSEIPFVDQLGDALDEAIADVAPRRRVGAVAAFVAAFVAVLALGLSWWALPRPAPEATAPSTTTTVAPDAADTVVLPSEFAQVPDGEIFGDGTYFFLGDVQPRDGQFVAFGTVAGGSVVLTSADGLAWVRRPGPSGTMGIDAALVADGSLLVGGMDAAQGPGLWREDELGDWVRLRLPAAGLAVASVREVVVGGDGLLAVGQAILSIEEDSPVSAVVWTSAGDEWRRIDDPSFVGSVEVDANGVAAHNDATVISGVWSEREGEPRAVVWTSPDLSSWRRIELPLLEDFAAGSWATDVVWTGSQYVSIGGERLVDGTAGAIWTSPDGITWGRVPHDAALLAAGGLGELRLNQLELIDGGVLALGVVSRGVESSALVLTSPDGASWDRIDLSGPSSVAAGAAEIDGTVIVVGAANVATAALRGAVWISPVPRGMEVAAPEPEPQDAVEMRLVAEPNRAAAVSRVKVTAELGDSPRPDGPGAVMVIGPAGEIEACSITFAPGYPPWCAFHPAEVGLNQTGIWQVDLVIGDEVIAQSTVEVVPPGTVVARLSVGYVPYYGPPVASVYVRNFGDEPLDLSGWVLDNAARSATFEFPAGMVIDPGGSAGLVHGPNGSDDCGSLVGSVTIVCPDYSGGPDNPIVDPGMEAYVGGVVLLDPDGVEVDAWSPADES